MNNQFGRGAFATPPITLNLIIANFVVWLACAILPIGDAIREYGMLYWVGSEKFHLYQFFTYMFLHADFQHMFFNMFSLWMFGRTLEIDLGPKKFLTYFFVCGVGAALLHMGVAAVEWLNIKSHIAAEAAAMGVSAAQLANKIFTNHAMLGASGAVMGVVMSFGVLHPNAMVMLMFPPIPMKAKWFVVIFLVIEFSAGVVGVSDSVAHFAHLGGMLWGWLLLRYWKKTHQIYY
ncbi:MAG: rhomboid family intramembrane serine protease [Rikenellaceae bacterium]|nr:rhomboid family intramembrane serine protease [Rikenellaceae bacterium]MBP3612225.1 rhomboid family intramembrane serine protease [Rikenellaceae bacterium]MBR4055286.1 rhomboid family intramembrane serine protease [Rikenellaceae bacterium]